MSAEYDACIARKSVACTFESAPHGELAGHLFPFQRDLTEWALNKGRAAIFAQCGFGKTPMALEWAQQVSAGGRVLILAPLGVADQTVREGEKFGVDMAYRRQDCGDKITISNYEMMEHFDPDKFVGVVLDECFAAGTMVDTPLGSIRIETVRPGDEIINACGVDVVADVHRREVPYAVRIRAKGQRIICSPNHPFLTDRGWVCAQDLVPGDNFTHTSEAMRLVRSGVCTEMGETEAPAILRDILFSEMAYEHARTSGKGAHTGSRSETGTSEKRMVPLRRPGSIGPDRTNSITESNVGSGGAGEVLSHIESDEPQTFRAWGEWTGPDGSATDHVGCTWHGMDSGVCFVTGPVDSWVSNALQDRHRARRSANSYRGGWSVPLLKEGSGCEEGRKTGSTRLDSLEILEPGHPDLECLRDAGGKLYFYDLGATRHPSFSVNGCLVHNSSIIKSHDGKTRNLILSRFSDTPYRLACTATPAPNDITEIGNHSEFLGALTRTEMLAEYFVHDGGKTQDWRLKGHAARAFWEWVSTWGAVIRSPAVLGYDDSAYQLPPMRIVEHVLKVDHAEAHEAGLLFAADARELSAQRAIRRATMQRRVDTISDLVAAEPDEPWLILCDLNPEGDALEDAIPHAVQVAGADPIDQKRDRLLGFSTGKYRHLVSKVKIAGFGLNYQHCARIAFMGPSHSYEGIYQAIRRCWRYGQTRPVEVHVVCAENEQTIIQNFRRKEADADRLAAETEQYIGPAMRAAMGATIRRWHPYSPDQVMQIPAWLK